MFVHNCLLIKINTILNDHVLAFLYIYFKVIFKTSF